MLEFKYDKNLINTEKDITISVADLRDLVNANSLNSQDMKDEVWLILQSIIKKNGFEKSTFAVDFKFS